MMAMGRHHSQVPAPLFVWRSSERIVAAISWRNVPTEVVLGSLLVEAMDLIEVVRFEAGHQVVEKREQIHRRLIG